MEKILVLILPGYFVFKEKSNARYLTNMIKCLIDAEKIYNNKMSR